MDLNLWFIIPHCLDFSLVENLCVTWNFICEYGCDRTLVTHCIPSFNFWNRWKKTRKDNKKFKYFFFVSSHSEKIRMLHVPRDHQKSILSLLCNYCLFFFFCCMYVCVCASYVTYINVRKLHILCDIVTHNKRQKCF